MKKLLFVFNPYSGTGKICKHLAEIIDTFTKAGYMTTVYPTQAPGDGKNRIYSDGTNYDRIVVSGGDGMFHELVNAVLLLSAPVPVGYLPTGTVNDFAATNKIPKDLVEAAKIAASDYICSLDVGKLNEEYFSYVAAFGLGTHVAYETDQKAKNKWGGFAYLMEVVKSIDLQHFENEGSKMLITSNGQQIEGDFIFGAVSNSFSVAGMNYYSAGDVVLDDGIFEGLFIRRPKTIVELEQLKKGLIEKDFESSCLYYVKSDRFKIESEPIVWTLDGENGGEQEKVTISAEKKALYIALPEKRK